MAGERSLRVIFLTHYFPPEVGAPQSRLFELASRLVAAGHTVTVVTGFPNYPTGIVPPDYRGRRSMEEQVDGVRVLRTAVYATPNKGFVRRILNHLSFAFSSVTAVRRTGPAMQNQKRKLFMRSATTDDTIPDAIAINGNVSLLFAQSQVAPPDRKSVSC